VTIAPLTLEASAEHSHDSSAAISSGWAIRSASARTYPSRS
jgi:hypothetical protein